jgi:predicted nuclease with RNAse H fold
MPAGIPCGRVSVLVDAVVGIDVGGARKGFHAVALTAGVYADQLATGDASELAHCCRSVVRASVIAIDAPCRWSSDGRARPCEQELMQKGIWCFSSPTHQKAHTPHRTNYYGWMLQGEALYQALEGGAPEQAYPLVSALPHSGRGCFETFPHAITWHLRGGQAQAAQKRIQRRELLAQAGLDLTPLTSIDRIDAALCALTAQQVASGGVCVSYGEPETGLIVVPRGALFGSAAEVGKAATSVQEDQVVRLPAFNPRAS